MKLRGLTALLLAAMVLLLCGCGSTAKNYTADSMVSEDSYAEPMEEYDEDANTGLTGETANAPTVDSSRKLIYTADYTIKTTGYEADYDRIVAALTACGGFISSEVTKGVKPEAYGDSGRTTEFTLRVPIDAYASFLDALAGVGECTRKTQTANDVTVSYYDNEARIALYEEHYNKLMEYLKNATDMEDIIALESEMTDILYTLDTLKGQQRYYDDQIAYTTVNVSLNEQVAAAEVVTSKESLGSRIGGAFTSVLKGMGVFFEGFLVFLVGALPILAVLAALFCVIFFPIRASARRKARKRAEALKTAPPTLP